MSRTMRKRSVLPFLIAFSVILAGSLGFAVEQTDVRKTHGKSMHVPDELVVRFAATVGEEQKNALKNKYQLQKKRDSKKAGKFTVYKHLNPKKVAELLRSEPGVLGAEQNALAYAFEIVPNDPYFPYQWDMSQIGMEAAWELSTGSNVVVAVIDTGVKRSLEDLATTRFVAGWDFVNDDNDPTDDEGHGSHVAGTIAQSTHNGIGCVGVAYNASIMPIKVLGRTGSGSFDDIADGIYWATDNGAHVINLSLGGASSLQILEDAVDYAWNHGVVVVCAAGNDSVSSPFYPAAYTHSISVSATTSIDTLASYSNYGSTIDISAPGGDSGDNNGDGYDDMILQNTFVRNKAGYYFFAGTSMASPHVAGVAALVKAANFSLTNQQIRNILESEADDIGTPGWDQYFGNGRLNAYNAVVAAGGGVNPNLPPTAAFSFLANELEVGFVDASQDSDGSISSWHWDFGDGTTASIQNPVHTYAAAGTYGVTLTVSDNEGATANHTESVTVSSGSTGDEILLSLNGYKVRGVRYVDLSWSGALGTTVNIYRDGALIATTPNDGSFTDNLGKVSGSFTYTVCEADGSACSAPVTVVL